MIIPGIKFVQGRNDYDDYDQLKFGIAIHNTANDATAEQEASYATRRTDGVSSHLYADAVTVIQSLDTKDRAGHAGSSTGNDNALAVEITGNNSKSREWWLANVNWTLLGQSLASVIKHHWPDGSFKVRRASVAEMKSNPKVKAFYSHDDMRLAWGGTTHTDPGSNFPWDKLFTAVNTALTGGADMALTNDDIERIWAYKLQTTVGDYVAKNAIMVTLNRTGTIQNDKLPELTEMVTALAVAVAALQEAVTGLTSPPPVQAVVDYEQVKAATKAALREGTAQ